MENLRRHFNFAGQNGKGSADRSSVFHVDVDEKEDLGRGSESSSIPLSNGGQNGNQSALNVFLQCLCRYHGAGTQLREQLTTALKGTLYEPLAAMCTTKLTLNLFESRPDLLQIGNEVHTLLSSIQDTPPKTEASQQVLLKCTLLLLKLDSLYHQMCLEEVQTSIHELSQACTDHSCHDILNLITSLELSNQGSLYRIQNNTIRQDVHVDVAPPISHGGHDSLLSVNDNNHTAHEELISAKLPPKQSSKSSIFNIFGRKNSPDEGKSNNGSSFYVDIKSDSPSTRSSSESAHQLLVDTGNGLSVSVTPPPSNDWNSHSLLPLIPKRLPSPGDINKGTRAGQMASEEEIDSVINLLSGCTNSNSSNSSSRASPLMHSIPENKISSPRLDVPREQLLVTTPTGPLPSGGPVITNIPITVTHETDSLKPPPRTQLHRRSEGSIDFTSGRNTWPHQHRNPNPLGFQSGFHDPLPQDPLFGRRFSSEFQNRPRGYNGNHLISNSHWMFPDSKLHQNWHTLSSYNSSQASGLATAGSDTNHTMNSSWSGFQDSSDLSDDSSSGEQFFAVGLDLVNALDSKNDSSDDECDRTDFYRDCKDQRVRSLENLMDVKSTHTWPPKQPWARSALVISEAMEASVMDNPHRPLQMQWSDPMSSRNVWGAAGLGPQLSHRSIHDFGHLPH